MRSREQAIGPGQPGTGEYMGEPWRTTPGPPSRPFGVRSRERGKVIIVELEGEVDLASAAEMRAALDAAIAREPTLVVADLTAVDVLDSTGLGALIDAAASTAEGCELAILAPGGLYVRGVLSVSGVLGRITIFESEHEIERHLRP